MIKDVLVGVAISWLTLTEDGKRFQKKAKDYIVERYLIPKSNGEKQEHKDSSSNGTTTE